MAHEPLTVGLYPADAERLKQRNETVRRDVNAFADRGTDEEIGALDCTYFDRRGTVLGKRNGHASRGLPASFSTPPPDSGTDGSTNPLSIDRID